MGEGRDSRTRLLIGDEGFERLRQASVMVAGLGGVGGYVAEMLGRSGVGHLILIDADTVAESNINRQLIAHVSTVGFPKSELWASRLRQINPDLRIEVYREFISPDNVTGFLDKNPDYVADAIDTVAPKCSLIQECITRHLPLISSMGAGGRLDPSQVQYGRLSDTRGDGLARTVRIRMRKQGIDPKLIKVVWSSEQPASRALIGLEERNKRSSFGTLASIPALFGIFMANKIIRELANC